MPIKHAIHTGFSLNVLLQQVLQGDHNKQIILVDSSVDQGLIRRALQKEMGGCSPKVEVLSRQLAAWLKFCVDAGKPTLFLTPTERRLAMSLWVEEARMDLSDSQIDRIHRMLSWMYVQGMDPVRQEDIIPEYGRYISAFIRWMQDRSWQDRSALFLHADKVSPALIGYHQVHVYLPGMIEPSQQKALDALIKRSDEHVEWHLYEFSSELDGRISQAASSDTSMTHHDLITVGTLPSGSVRLELEQVFSHIKSRFVSSDHGTDDAPQYFSDIMILVSDMDHYAHHIEMAAHRFEVPTSSTQGPVMISDPAIGRLRQYLYLSVKDFQIDDIIDVFADQLIPLLSQITDEMESPNLRTFGAFCKRYNIRNLDQLERELDRALHRETERSEAILRKTKPEAVPEEHLNFEQVHGEFYRDIRNRLVRLREEYLSGSQPMSHWYEWAKAMLDRLGVVKDADLMNAIRALGRTIDKALASIGRLGYDPVAHPEDFAHALDAFMNVRMTRNQHPGAVMVAPFEEVSFTDRKWVYVVGLSDGYLPKRSRMDEVFPRAGKEVLSVLQSIEKDHHEDARQRLSVIAREARQLILSWPTMVAGRAVMVSPLVLDAASNFPDWHLSQVGPIEKDARLDRLSLIKEASAYPIRRLEDIIPFEDTISHARLVSAIALWRSNPDEIGLWEGMLSVRTPWEVEMDGIRQRAWGRLTKSGHLRMSVTRFDEFSQSPLEYFFKRIVRLQKPDEYSDEAEQNRKGDLLHAILEHYYTPASSFGPLIHPADDPEGAKARIRTIAQAIFAEHTEDLGHPDTPYPELLKTQILKTLDGYIETEQMGPVQLGVQTRSELRPSVFWDSKQPATEVGFELILDVDQLPIRIHGFIDRLDTNKEDTKRVVYDYKTGSLFSIKRFDEDTNLGMSFQLPIYLHSMDVEGDKEILAAYYHISISKEGQDIRLRGLLGDTTFVDDLDKKQRQKDFKGVMSASQRRAFVQAIIEYRVKPIIRAIREGRFHQSLTKPSPYSDYMRMSRWSQAVSDMRNIALIHLDQDPQDIFNRFYVKMPVIDVYNPQAYLSGETNDD